MAPARSAISGRPEAAQDCMPPATLTADTPCWDRNATTRADRAADHVQRVGRGHLVEPAGELAHRHVPGVGCVARGPLVVLADVEQHGVLGEVGHADRGHVHLRILARPRVTPR